jgi:hypothetical protein
MPPGSLGIAAERPRRRRLCDGPDAIAVRSGRACEAGGAVSARGCGDSPSSHSRRNWFVPTHVNTAQAPEGSSSKTGRVSQRSVPHPSKFSVRGPYLALRGLVRALIYGDSDSEHKVREHGAPRPLASTSTPLTVKPTPRRSYSVTGEGGLKKSHILLPVLGNAVLLGPYKVLDLIAWPSRCCQAKCGRYRVC